MSDHAAAPDARRDALVERCAEVAAEQLLATAKYMGAVSKYHHKTEIEGFSQTIVTALKPVTDRIAALEARCAAYERAAAYPTYEGQARRAEAAEARLRLADEVIASAEACDQAWFDNADGRCITFRAKLQNYRSGK